MELNEAMYLGEGKFVKEVNPKWVKPILKDFLIPKIDKERQRDPEVDPATKTSKLKLAEYMERFIYAAMQHGKFSKSPFKSFSKEPQNTKSFSKTSDFSSGYYAIQIMNELHLDTNKPGNIAKFEKELTKRVEKELKKHGIKLSAWKE